MRKYCEKIETIITIVLNSSPFIEVHQSLLFRIEEKLVALLVYYLFVPVANSGFRMIPY